MKFIYLICYGLLLTSCWGKKPYLTDQPYGIYKKGYGWKPVYGADTAYKKLTYYPTPRPMENAGKLYVIGNTIYQNDFSKGIHIIDNSNPSNAHRIAFIALPGNTEMAVKGNYMYANNFNDLVVIDISNAAAPVEVKRLPNMFSTNDSQRPYFWQAPPDSGFFECPRYYNDSIIISWIKDSIYQNCYRR